ncbi:MAG: glycosyltransferase family 2 protein [Paracoccus sp. (in: a-proteobacteria)]
MSRPLVSVLINNYNYGRFLDRALDSALQQTGPSAEVIVVDDGSTDDSRAVIERRGSAVRAIFQPNRGQAAAMNAAVAASCGQILCFLDADDWWHPGKLAETVKAFDLNPGTGLVYHRLQPVRSRSLTNDPPVPRTLCHGDLSARMARSAGVWPYPMTSAISVLSDAMAQVGPIPSGFVISADAWLVGAIPFLWRVTSLPQTLGSYRVHNNNWHRDRDDAQMLRRRMAHWEMTVAELNAFLIARNQNWHLSLADHFPHRAASAQLAPPDLPGRVGLFLDGIRFAGEPNPLRRLRDAMRVLRRARRDGTS